MKFRNICFMALCGFGFILNGCNKASHNVEPTYISSYRYDNKSCTTLKKELEYVTERADIMAHRVDERKSSQDTKMAFGWLFWPSYLVIDSNDYEVQELAKLRGEYNALNIAITNNGCK